MKKLSNLQDYPDYDNHEMLLEINEPKIKLQAFIAIHNTVLGPATGGTRMFFYASRADAIADSLRLSRAMTYKCALAGVGFGGGKGVIIGDPCTVKTNALLKGYAHAVNELKGSFTTGEDVGLTENDIMILSSESEYIHGRKDKAGELGPWAALGVFRAIQAALIFRFNSENIENRIFAVKGLGKVGLELSRIITEKGGSIIGADINPKAVSQAIQKFPKMKIVDTSIIAKQDVDVYCPCALGNEFSKDSIMGLKCKIVCGATNNQLENADIGESFYERGIVYVPDYVANAGGLINIVSEVDIGGYNLENVKKKIDSIKDTTKNILTLSKENNESTSRTADKLAKQIIDEKKNKKK